MDGRSGIEVAQGMAGHSNAKTTGLSCGTLASMNLL
jgi:hypothetical protein